MMRYTGNVTGMLLKPYYSGALSKSVLLNRTFYSLALKYKHFKGYEGESSSSLQSSVYIYVYIYICYIIYIKRLYILNV